ncbi:unnamed protein product [Sphenostylis stenocarpa]|uniref:Uncharacterized protein n=1 Tax=Sphenostylis stenocarpa TaxID=92480 RepID=A0AA86VFZ1_9FABA|nr:unnamed protein product [Sphenostylis stenocarpa]
MEQRKILSLMLHSIRDAASKLIISHSIRTITIVGYMIQKTCSSLSVGGQVRRAELLA